MKRTRVGYWPLFAGVMAVNSGVAAPQVPKPNPSPVLTREAAVAYALEHNPQLAVVREQRGLAAAGVVLARVYPYNPILNSVVLGVNGPSQSDVTNHVFNEHTVTLQLELFGQGKHRRAAADAAVTRTEWEIATQELATATSVVRAYDTVLYREQKLRILDETVRLSDQLVEIGRQLADAQKLNTADLIILGKIGRAHV